MKLHGALDNLVVMGETVVLGGWAYCDIDAERFAVESVEVDGVAIDEVKFISRRDFGDSNRFGFSLKFQGVAGLAALMSGFATCHVVFGGERASIGLWKRLHGRILALFLSRMSEGLDSEGKNEVASAAVALVRGGRSNAAEEIQEIYAETGLESYDRSVVLGRDGHVFLYGGSNSVHALYERSVSYRLLDDWEMLVRSRKAVCDELGVKFLQIVIPEKQSVLSDLFPLRIDAPTPMVSQLRNRLNKSDAFLDLQTTFERMYREEGFYPYRRVDSHLSFHGAMRTVQEVCLKLTGEPLTIELPILVEKAMGGDLGNKFGFGNIIERALVPVQDGWNIAQSIPTLIEAFDPPSGHTGSARHWSNDRPLIDKKVLVFGNSMFERGGSSFGLAWWFARIFQSTTFIWEAAVDSAKVVEMRPDYVVAQTVERFLTGLPKS